jgi:phospholipase/carboxylesterase
VSSQRPGHSPAREAWPHQLRPSTRTPDGALILLHGRGTDEFDLLPLLEALDTERRLVGLTPRAPLSLPPGGAHWYVVRRVGYPDRDTFFDSLSSVSAWLDLLPDELGIPWERIVLGGFSMGAVMSYAIGLGPGRPTPAGIMALSGFIPTVEGFELELERARGLPAAIAHGTADAVIPVEFGRDARRRLEAAGADVLYRESPVVHTIDPAIVPDLRAWLARTIPPTGEAP